MFRAQVEGLEVWGLGLRVWAFRFSNVGFCKCGFLSFLGLQVFRLEMPPTPETLETLHVL